MNLALKVRADRKRRKQQKPDKPKTKVNVGIRYNKCIEPKFKKKDEINMNKFVGLSKEILTMGLGKPALAIYPVLCSMANFEIDKPFQKSQKEIGYFAGISAPTVKIGLEELEKYGIITSNKAEGYRHLYWYEVDFVRQSRMKKEKGNFVYFHTSVIESGIWASLKSRAKVLYHTMLCNATLDLDYYCLVMEHETGENYELNEFDEYLQNREWDVVNLSMAKLCKQAGISGTNYKDILEQLEYHRLADRYADIFRVWLKPNLRVKG